MTERDKTALWLALRGTFDMEVAGNAILDEIAFADLQSITPAVEEIERNAENRGRFAQLLEDAAVLWYLRNSAQKEIA
jgi:hypothetical protein